MKLRNVLPLLVLFTGCVTAPPPSCEVQLNKIINDDIAVAKQCISIVAQEAIASSAEKAPSLKITIMCSRTVEFVGMISILDKELTSGVSSSPNTKSYGQCSNQGKIYEIFNSSVALKEKRA